jgi:outer membrane lipoprotein SlyB
MSAAGLSAARSTVLRALAAIAVLGVAACASPPAATIYGAADSAGAQTLSYGTIVSMRPVTLQGEPAGIGILGGAILGSAASNVADQSASGGRAMEFIVQEDNSSQPISVIQTNELNFRPGDRVIVNRSARTRLARAARPGPA